MPSFRRFLSRRWLLGFLAAALLFGLAMLHPYPRQSLFGPTIRGKPWCYWDHEIRHFWRPRPKALPLEWRIRGYLGIWEKEWEFQELFDHEEMLPLVLELTADEDPAVCNFARNAILSFDRLQKESALPFLQEQLHEFAATYRVAAAKAIWRINKGKQVIPVLARVLKEANTQVAASANPPPNPRLQAILALIEISREAPEVLPEIAGYQNDNNAEVRAKARAHITKVGFAFDGN